MKTVFHHQTPNFLKQQISLQLIGNFKKRRITKQKSITKCHFFFVANSDRKEMQVPIKFSS